MPDFTLALPSIPTSPSAARRFVQDALVDMGERDAEDIAVLLASELVTNAVLHGEAPISLQVSCTKELLRVEVTDSSSTKPAPRQAGPGAVSGRGLDLVDALSSAWGVDQHADNGKAVWFELPLASSARR